jgi:hypothetical protein
LIGRCYRRLIAPLSGPIKDQDLRIVASVLRLSGPEAFSHVAVAFSLSAAACSLMPSRFSKLRPAAADVSVPEIIPGLTTIVRCLTKFTIRPAEVMEGFTEATMVVAVVMVAIVAATFVPAVVLVEQTAQLLSDHHSEGTSEYTSGDSSEDTSESISISISRHSVFSIVARGARACSMPTPGCL